MPETRSPIFSASNVPYYLVTDYLMWDQLDQFTTAPSDAQIEQIFDETVPLWSKLQGTDALRTELDMNLDNALAFLSDPLPAYFPLDAMTEEITQLNAAIRANGFGWQQSAAPTAPRGVVLGGRTSAFGQRLASCFHRTMAIWRRCHAFAAHPVADPSPV